MSKEAGAVLAMWERSILLEEKCFKIVTFFLAAEMTSSDRSASHGYVAAQDSLCQQRTEHAKVYTRLGEVEHFGAGLGCMCR